MVSVFDCYDRYCFNNNTLWVEVGLDKFEISSGESYLTKSQCSSFRNLFNYKSPLAI